MVRTTYTRHPVRPVPRCWRRLTERILTLPPCGPLTPTLSPAAPTRSQMAPKVLRFRFINVARASATLSFALCLCTGDFVIIILFAAAIMRNKTKQQRRTVRLSLAWLSASGRCSAVQLTRPGRRATSCPNDAVGAGRPITFVVRPCSKPANKAVEAARTSSSCDVGSLGCPAA